MNDLFNTPFETGLRAILILSVIRSCGMTIDRLSAYDFMTIYGKDFEVSDRNLHGDNSYSFSELSSKRSVCSEGIKMFVLDGLIAVSRTEGGFLYMMHIPALDYEGSGANVITFTKGLEAGRYGFLNDVK